jgi:hypothetical protein
MAGCIKGLDSQGYCLEMSFPSLWKDCMKKSLCGVSRERVLRGLRRFMVVFMGPYSCLFWRICKAYADVGLLFLMDLVCS